MTRINWPSVLQDIAHVLGEDTPGTGQRIPLGTRSLADALGVDRGALRNWLAGSEPRYSDGDRILDRWRALTGKPREFAPMERAALSASAVR